MLYIHRCRCLDRYCRTVSVDFLSTTRNLDSLGPAIQRGPGEHVHQKVQDRLRALIEAGTWSVGAKLPGETVIASNLGVSRMTANKAILALVREGYLVRDKGSGTYLAPRKQTARSRCAIVVNEPLDGIAHDPYFGTVFFGLQHLGQESGWLFNLYRLDQDLPDLFQTDGVDAAIFMNVPRKHVDLVNEVARARRTLVLGSNWSELNVPCVDSDNVLGSATATAHLISLGHKRIGFLGACPEDANTQDRIKGFELLTTSHGLAPDGIWVSRSATGIDEDVRQAVTKRLKSPDRPTAFVVGGGNPTLQLIQLVQSLGLSVPEDVSVVGYDDLPFMSIGMPTISTIRQPLEEMVERAHEFLSEPVTTGKPCSQCSLKPLLIERKSTANEPKTEESQP